MKYLGIDYGSKRVGIAVSDEDGKIAFPHIVLDRLKKEELLKKIKEICEINKIDKIIIGESKDFSQKPNPIMKDINNFVGILKREGIEVEMHPEFLTSLEATRSQGNVKNIDASAAAIILQNYMDLKNH